MLMVVHTMASCHRLLDVAGCVETDPRVQTVYTVAPDAFRRGVAERLAGLGALILPWAQVRRERFDLAVAAAWGGLPELHAPLLVMAHGAGRGKRTRPAGRGNSAARPEVYGLDAARLVRDGELVASALALAHESEREVLRRQCPEALPTTVVVGDPCLDRLLASIPGRQRYRDALGLAADERLLLVSSTWGPDGLFGAAPDLLPRLMTEAAPAGYRVAALLHPAVWTAHGHRQVRAWLRDCRAAGLLLADPADDWRIPLLAADRVLGDHGSVTAYAAAIGVPTLRHPTGRNAIAAAGSVSGRLDRLDPARPVLPQLAAADRPDQASVVAALSSRPGQAHRLLRRTMYRLLALDEPGRHRGPDPVEC
ncbi:hypothetical protein ABZS66_30170 [Dactylosporangium sp. NPDC005572]|uniref:hypothetical protein n=1 Tax=Dactylosporangium sp. NPDC005572 TaxID=3156889 RepID=UPI0033A42A12